MSVAEELHARLQASNILAETWTAYIGDFLPTQRQFLIWCALYDPAIILKGIQRTAIWSSKKIAEGEAAYLALTDRDYVRYASGVMANTKRETANERR